MKKVMKTEDVLKLFNIISIAKYSKMDDSDKIKVWKIARKTKPVATKFEEDTKDAAEKFKADFKDFDARLQKAQEYERAKQQGKDTAEIMRDADYNDFIKDFKDYQNLVNKAIKEFADVEVEVDFETITEDAFGKLMASNEWNMEQTMALGELIVEEPADASVEEATAEPAKEVKIEKKNKKK